MHKKLFFLVIKNGTKEKFVTVAVHFTHLVQKHFRFIAAKITKLSDNMAPVSLTDHLSDHDKMVLEAIFTPTQIGQDFSSISYSEDLPNELKG